MNSGMDIATQIKDKLDIVEVISRYVILKKKGNNYWGCCPFHNEKTPSFSVSPSKNLFKCFGCGEGGDVLTFLMKINNQSFGEMIKEQAEALGIELPNSYSSSKDTTKIKDEAYKCLEKAAEVYMENLNNVDIGANAKKYLTNRGITDEVIKTYKLGFSLPAYTGLQDKFGDKFSKDILEKAGLIIKRENGKGYVDRFRGRLMIPIQDEKGRVVAFGARALEEGQNPKYLNSPDSIVYNKSNILYGIYHAIDTIKEQDAVVIMEGYFDVISTQMAGIKNCIASCGTSLTSGHIKMLSRYTPSRKIYLAFDADNAGQKASKRGADIIKEELSGLGEIKQYDERFAPFGADDKYSCEIRVVVPPEGKDADEFIRENGKEKYLEAVKNAPLLLDFQIEQILKKKTKSMTPTEKSQLVKEVIPILLEINNNIVRDEYAKLIATQLGVNDEILSSELRNFNRPKNNIVTSSPTIIKKSNNNIQKAQKNLLSLFLLNECDTYIQSLKKFLQKVEFEDENLKILLTTIDKLSFQVNNVVELIQALYVTFAENNDLRNILTELIDISKTFVGADYPVVIEENLAVISDSIEQNKTKELNTMCINAEDDETSAEYQRKLVEQLKQNLKTGETE